jgi:hypothetical protein
MPPHDRYHALSDHQRRSLPATNYWLALKGEPVIQVPEEDTEYHRAFRWPEPQIMMNPNRYPFPYCELTTKNTMTTTKRSLLELTQSQLTLIATLEETGGELTPEIEAQLAINKDQLTEKICAYQEVIVRYASTRDAAKAQIDRLAATSKHCQSNIDRLEYYMLEALKAYGQQDAKGIYRLEAISEDNVVNLATRKSSSVEITDKDALPFEYWRVPEVTAAPDKKLIKDAIDKGTEVPGAKIVESLNLVIK